MTHLLPSITAAFTKGLAVHLAARLGESEAGTRKALQDAVAVVLSGLISKAASREAAWLFELSADDFRAANSAFGTLTGMLGMFGSAHDLKHGENVVSTLFGQAGSDISVHLAGSARIRTESATQLLGLVGAVLTALLGQWAASRSMSVGDFSAELAGLKRQVRALVPQELRGLAAEPLAQRTARETVSRGSNPWASEMAMQLTFAAVVAAPRLYRVRLAVVSFALLAAFYIGVGKLNFAGKTEEVQPLADTQMVEQMGTVDIAPVVVPVSFRLTEHAE
ncbi:MAG TPA: DUF937 domain-containing protein [Hymenobacter sp.]|jgi:hypothetical protein|uniref:DUF937 domain-containing protein n=1 Tax=Hymenobacter sp. TaxID=1898978 RepID=UPI002ED9A77B